MKQINNFGIWFTGLSGSGKSTLSNYISKEFNRNNILNYVLDCDTLRKGINNDLSFSKKDRSENIRRVSYIFNIIYDIGVIPISACISPFQEDRNFARKLIPENKFIEIFLSTPIEVCEQRDIKGLYSLEKQGKILEFTGITSPYEIPENPELIINTENFSIEECSNQIIDFLYIKNLII